MKKHTRVLSLLMTLVLALGLLPMAPPLPAIPKPMTSASSCRMAL